MFESSPRFASDNPGFLLGQDQWRKSYIISDEITKDGKKINFHISGDSSEDAILRKFQFFSLLILRAVWWDHITSVDNANIYGFINFLLRTWKIDGLKFQMLYV